VKADEGATSTKSAAEDDANVLIMLIGEEEVCSVDMKCVLEILGTRVAKSTTTWSAHNF